MLCALTEWLSTRAVGFDERVALTPKNSVTALQPLAEGDTAFELLHGALLTPASVFADRETGRDLESYAARIGPGFGTVALATFVALERVRGFRAATWFAGSASPTGAASEWSPLTRSHWELEAARPSRIDPDLIAAVAQGTHGGGTRSSAPRGGD